MNLWEAVLLGIVEGVTEFLPISSTGHLTIAEELLKVADEAGATMIVIGMRHRTPVGKLLMGSVAQRVLLDSKVPVLAVKP